jgi:LytS/YehU family sensor histidine kinase
VVGIFVAGLVLVGVGVTTLDRIWSNYLTGVQIALAISVPVTVGAVTYAKLHHQLARTEASLHAKELEHQKALALATEARLASLESRVRPHFLFNALNSAIALIPEDPPRAENLLERLAHLLRVSLDTAASTVALGDELRIVTDYLEIERVRFGDRLRYEIDVPEALRGAVIPVFAVQTVVENSVKYAVSARKAGAQICVRARRDGDRLRLDITDDGPGFSGPIWLPGHGLDGLRSRLFALHGPAARVVAPAEGATGAAGAAAGAAVTIELPDTLPEARPAALPEARPAALPEATR